jgi:hypothetical protein
MKPKFVMWQRRFGATSRRGSCESTVKGGLEEFLTGDAVV